MLNNACVYNNKIFIVNNNTLCAYECSEDDKSGYNFSERFNLDIPIPSNFLSIEVYLDVVESYSKRLKCLMILAISTSNTIAIFRYIPLVSKTLKPVKTLNWTSNSTIEPNINLFFKDGPTLIIFLDGVIQIYSLRHNTESFLNLKTCLPISNNSVSMKLCVSIRQIYLDVEPVNVMLLMIKYGQSSDSELHAISVDVKVEQKNSLAVCKKLPVSLFFPKCFQNLLKCINVLNVGILKRSSFKSQEINWKENYSIICSHQECFIFSGGNLLYMTQIPQPDILFICTEFCDFPRRIVNLILLSKSGHVDLLKIPFLGGEKLEIAKSWSSVKCILTGEVLCNSTNHLLLLKDTSTSWHANCMMFDVSCFSLVDLMKVDEESDPILNPAILALESTVQAGESAIIKAESEISKKLSASMEVIFRLNDEHSDDILMHQNVATFQESLVDILLHQDENCQRNTEIQKDKVYLKIQKHWKRFIDNQCMLCWTLSNEGKRSICNPVIKVTIPNRDVTSTQKLFVHKTSLINERTSSAYEKDKEGFKVECRKTCSEEEEMFIDVNSEEEDNAKSSQAFSVDDEFFRMVNAKEEENIEDFEIKPEKIFSIEDESCREVNHNEWFSIVSAFPIPEFHSSEVKVSALLTWCVGTAAEFENEVYLPVEDSVLTQQQMTLESTLLASDIISVTLKDITTVEDLACMKVLQQRVVLEVRSLQSDLSDIANSLLSSAYGSAHLLLIESSGKKCLIFKSANLPLFGVQLTFECVDMKKTEIEAFTKSNTETSLLVEHLYHYLPADVLIQSIGATTDESVVYRQQAVLAMKEEIDLVLSSLHIHNVGEGMDKEQESIEVDTVVIPKNNFLRIRRALVKKELKTDHVMQKLSDIDSFISS